MLSSTVRCGNRLYCWNTTPIRARTASTSTRGSLMSASPSQMRPSSIGSSRFMVRSSVDLPEPLAPMRATTSPGATSRSMPCSTRGRRTTSRRPRGAGRARRAHTIPPICSRARTRAVYQSVRRIVGIASSTNSSPATTYGVKLKYARGLDLRRAHGVDRAEHRDEADVLLHRDEVVHERGRHLAHGLRHDDQPHRLAVAEAERAGGVALRRMHRLDAGAEDLGHVGRVGEGERDRAPELGGQAHRDQLQPRDAEADEVQHDDERDAAEQVGVAGGERAQRQPDRARGACAASRAAARTRSTQHRRPSRAPAGSAGSPPTRAGSEASERPRR